MKRYLIVILVLVSVMSCSLEQTVLSQMNFNIDNIAIHIIDSNHFIIGKNIYEYKSYNADVFMGIKHYKNVLIKGDLSTQGKIYIGTINTPIYLTFSKLN